MIETYYTIDAAIKRRDELRRMNFTANYRKEFKNGEKKFYVEFYALHHDTEAFKNKDFKA